MNHPRYYASCAKINDHEVIVLGHTKLDIKEVEIYDLNKNTWTVRDEYYLPINVGLAGLISHKGRLILIGGTNSTGQKMDSVWEWDKKNGWKEKARRLTNAANNWNGNIIPFVRSYPKPN